MICPSCGQESPESFRFCPACAAPLDQEHAPAREEHKVVTVLFADLVGFTSRSEQLDPEDVRAVLAPYHARLRKELERYGGTVDEAEARLRAAVEGRRTEAGEQFERALAFYRAIGATRYASRCEQAFADTA